MEREHPEVIAAHMERLTEAVPVLRAARIREKLVSLVEAIDAYTGQGGPWDNVLYQVEGAKLLLYPTSD